MSLRDQLMKKGLASKADGRRANRDLKKKRKGKQSNRKRKGEEARIQAQKERKEQEQRATARALERRDSEQKRAVSEAVTRVRQIISGNRLGSKGPVVFFHKKMNTAALGRLQVSERVAWSLRCGDAAIAALEEGDHIQYVVVTRRGAERLSAVSSKHVVFWTQDTHGISSPEEHFLKRDWEPTLGPHRVKEIGPSEG